ncbi:uncharacterized protein EV422DRAFT_287104 [Fimicolochytrium jonesii]|uniref:uncharacterized protein n=1 Tax=Fimicolochytrium jonesii TaxID=1396493 RepID=UPI0022FEF3CF|nr:uncharacterized protein EV422DRAFT_287104 [Fimicolochytrium jonesii]KAI8816517.1 hypothetical protein EV422DRAFT_287104 [Fimicolochytrium jonesii]
MFSSIHLPTTKRIITLAHDQVHATSLGVSLSLHLESFKELTSIVFENKASSALADVATSVGAPPEHDKCTQDPTLHNLKSKSTARSIQEPRPLSMPRMLGGCDHRSASMERKALFATISPAASSLIPTSSSYQLRCQTPATSLIPTRAPGVATSPTPSLIGSDTSTAAIAPSGSGAVFDWKSSSASTPPQPPHSPSTARSAPQGGARPSAVVLSRERHRATRGLRNYKVPLRLEITVVARNVVTWGKISIQIT